MKPMTKYEAEVCEAETAAAERRREPAPLERCQTSILQGLRRRGHPVSFAPEDLFRGTPEPPWKLIRPPAVPQSSQSVFYGYLAKWNGKPCPYCSETMMRGSDRPPTRDHKIPRSRRELRNAGVRFNQANILVVCRPCNGDKGAMTLEEFAVWLTGKDDPRAGLVWNLVARGG